MVSFAKGIANSPHRCPEIIEQRVQDPHPKSRASVASFFLRGVNQHCPKTAGASGSQSRTTLPIGRYRIKQLSRIRGPAESAHAVRMRDFKVSSPSEDVNMTSSMLRNTFWAFALHLLLFLRNVCLDTSIAKEPIQRTDVLPVLLRIFGS